MANVMPDVLRAFALKELMPDFKALVVHVTVVFAVLQVIDLRVAPLTINRYFRAPVNFLKVTFTVRPVKVHFTDLNAGVTTAVGVPGVAAGTVITGVSVGVDSDPPDVSTVVVVARASGNGVVVSSAGTVVVVIESAEYEIGVDCSE